MSRKQCFKYYWLDDLEVLACPKCGSCNYFLQLRWVPPEDEWDRELKFYSVGCSDCGFIAEEFNSDPYSANETGVIGAIWNWHLTLLDADGKVC